MSRVLKRGWPGSPLFVAVLALAAACEVVPVPPPGDLAESAERPERSGDSDPDAARRAAGEPRVAEPGGSEPGASEAGSTALGRGFLVWESNRGGAWRIWTRPLQGGAPRRLTPDEPGRQHYAPHISPDGRWVAYLSSRDGGRRYADGGARGELRLVSPSDGATRVLVEAARTYFENRAVVWRSVDELIFIGDDLRTRTIDLESGRTRELTRAPADDQGWLIDATLGHASANSPTFSVYDPERRRVVPRNTLGGCQPYFSHDGRWGVWVAGAGGPFERLDLETRSITRLLEKNDPRVPEGLGYLYFPMPSRDGSLLAFAGSRGAHDHFDSDYEIFVVETDPETLEPLGEVERLTEHPATDRYPDVWAEPVPLGRHRGEAPFEVAIATPTGEGWRWSREGLVSEDATAATYSFGSPGRYRIAARRGEERLRGEVVVAPARPPRVLSKRLSGDARRLEIELDEAVDAESLSLAFDSGRTISGWSLDASSRALTVELERPLEGTDRLALAGLEDLAQRPNRMERTLLEVGPPAWPARRDGLVLLWQTADSPNLVPAGDGVERAVNLTPSGLARLDHHYRMVPGGGSFVAERDDAARLAATLKASNEMTVALVVDPRSGSGSAGLVRFAGNRQQNFRLELVGRQLVFHLRTGGRGPRANTSVSLVTLPAGRASHVAVTYAPGRLSAYVDGELARSAAADEIRGDFFHWRPAPLLFGGGGSNLTLEAVAIYDRVLTADEVRAEHERYRSVTRNRGDVPRLLVEARLLARSEAPSLDEISPYREALVTFEYRVERVLEGEVGVERLRVAHWAILDGARLPLLDRRPGETYRLRLEPFAANPQIAGLYLGRDPGIATDAPLYFAPDPSD